MLSFDARSFITILARTSVCFFLTATPAPGQGLLHAVRVVDATLASTLREVYRTSPTLRALVDELEQSDVIVHVVGMAPHVSQLDGRLAFVHTGGGRRLLRIAVNPRLPQHQRAAVLGHELQHAVEVARAASVIDEASFRALYERIGYRVSSGSTPICYETDEARDAAEGVLQDVRRSAATRRGAPHSSARAGR